MFTALKGIVEVMNAAINSSNAGWRAFVMLLMLGLGGGVFVNYNANADDKEVQGTIQKNLTELSGKVDTLNSSVRQLVDSQHEREKQDTRTTLVNLFERVCKVPPGSELWSALNDQLNDIRVKYRGLWGEEFPIVTCRQFLGQ